MAINRISTFAVFQNTLSDVNQTQSRLFRTQDQISSGVKARDFEGISSKTEQFVDLEARVGKAKLYQEQNSQVKARLETTNVALDQIIQLTDEIEDLMVLRRNGAMADNINFEQQLTDKRDSLIGELNSTFEGRFIFGGTRTNVAPVSQEIPANVELGVPDNGYYQGTDENVTVRAQDNVEIEYNVRADAQGFQKLFASINTALHAHREGEENFMADAVDMVQEANRDIISVQATVNSTIVNLDQINERHQALELYWRGVTETIAKTDVLAASTQVAVDQAVLQASFQVFSQVNQLRLSDYLN
ncbi:MAG: hypothetical protein CMM94_05480 [Rickettsiales bacterium]|nr:hypothetical protein [Rickettsiales bacterium]